jgi:flagellar basal-body rod modification protein FlgD
MASINGVTGGWTSYEDTLRKTPGNDLGKEDFLKLLVAQLTHQDPTNPMQDTEFVAQLATYSGLEQQMNVNKNLEKLIATQNMSTAAQATSLIGAVISYVDGDGNYKMGQVAFLDIVGGEVNLILNDANNTSVPYSSVQQVGYPINAAPPSGGGDEAGSGDSAAAAGQGA